jgi:predicted ATPase/tetratricopeptide (TPR) repeat protein
MTQIGHYKLQDELGAGGMGTVYRGVDTHTEQTVAIKQLKLEVYQPENIERFKREGDALRDLNHPNIVKMLDMFEHEGQYYLVMEYVSGGDLATLLKQGQMPLLQILKLSIDLTDALTRAHKLDIIHRDLKPANVLIGDDSVLRLTDFGVAHVGTKERVTATDAIIGTLDYLPPEIFNGEIFDARGDIWAFGVMMFEMLAGHRPFSDGTMFEMIQNITVNPIPDLEILRPDAPVALIDLVYRMLERDPQARIRSVRIVGTELESILKGRDNLQVTNRFDTDFKAISHLPKNNLPAQTTSFIGREHELNELQALIEDASLRLITVIAPGGMGKTRLAIEAGNQALNGLGMSAYLIELAPLTDSTSIVSAIADALKYNFQNDERPPKQQILDYLANKTLLFIFDNYEHIIESASLVSDILSVSPHIQVLVTSRRPLKQQGETLFHLAGMDFPDFVSIDDAINYAAIKLFVTSAKRVVSDFVLDPQNLSDVILICRMVQGMPLGIVLAASWIGVLSTGEIVEEMEESMNFLETDEVNLPDRQRSMRVVMNYTWQMMSETEQKIFMQASVFTGGFTREAIQSVTNVSLRNLMSLANKSILHRNADTGRYTIHEMLRQYALEYLNQSGDAPQAHQRHMTYYANLMSAYEKKFRGGGQLISAMRIFERDIENIQVAWKYATDTTDFAVIDELLSGLFHFYDMRGWTVEGEQQFGRVAQVLRQKAGEDHNILLGKLIARQAKFLFYRGAHQKALETMSESVKLLDNAENDDELAAALGIYADALSYMGDFENALKLCERSLVILQKTNDKWGIASAYNNLGVTYYYLRDYDNAIIHYEKSMEISREVGDISGVTAILSNLGAIAHDQGLYQRATELYMESMNLSEMLHDQYGVASIQLNLGWTLFVTQKYQQAYTYTIQSIETAERLGNRWLLTTAHINIGAIACELDDLDTAKQYLALAYKELQQLEANQLLPDIITGVGSLLIKYKIYDQAYNLLVYAGQLPGLEHETKARIKDLIQTAEVVLQSRAIASK